MTIRFVKADLSHLNIIFEWLAEPHMMEFWDNSSEHKEDILNFIQGKKQHYFAGTTKYWVGYINNDPYCFILSDVLEKHQDDLSPIHQTHMSAFGTTISLDFGIGNKQYLEKGLAAPTLEEFMKFYHDTIDLSADTFFIDPDANNSRAEHVYSKAEFKQVGNYEAQAGAFKGAISYLMVKKL